MAAKTANGLQLFTRFIEQFDFTEGEDLDDEETLERARRYTFQIRNSIGLDRRVYEISVADIQRDLDVDIFTPRSYRLYQSITTAHQSFSVTLDQAESERDPWLFEHGGDYVIHPG